MFKVKLFRVTSLLPLLVFLILTSLLILVLIEGGFVVVRVLFPLLGNLSLFAFLLSVVLFLPLSMIENKKKIATKGFVVTSYILGVTLWTLSFITAYETWGVVGILIGLFFFGVGVIPVAFVATLVTLNWHLLLQLTLLFVVFYLTKNYSKKILLKRPREKRRDGPSLYGGEVENADYEEVD